ncbi:protein phosphatase 1 regulatory subunit 27-like [Dreissena polymorpha]|uniref:Uncharacterized protein n=1 Tax=Dreissena polymorpha TaxID=45954 RepID=A0A9D4KVH9_DREPO|nr:protein phosphatase 1 regulatory subunit 27-like [Dreissena polymorpha]XP_052273164.1 protein phosphatase 1 regulatory subunit 27-like [Dreissena polymorpha]KAH3846641.1 hypothetical protein DPMN_088943 [Dreissena polymorpha]KAH3846666.1 hypothetical protein DPMN_088968 [Dreissena polymorpha]
MSRRISMYVKQNPTPAPNTKQPRKGVRFPDELVFLDHIKENDVAALDHMLKRASLLVDISALNDVGVTPLHQAVLDGNVAAVRLLISHGADINKQDEDRWTPLHAACANGHSDIVKLLLEHGADKNVRTDDGELPADLIEPDDPVTRRAIRAPTRLAVVPNTRHTPKVRKVFD